MLNFEYYKQKNHSITDILYDYLKIDIPEPTQNINHRYTKKEFNHTATITHKLFALRKILVKQIGDLDLNNTAIIEFNCIPATIQMDIKGIGIDWERINTSESVLQANRDQLFDELSYSIPEDVNINSPKQLLKVLNFLGINIDNTKHETLTAEADQHPIIQTILDYRRTNNIHKNHVCSCIQEIHPLTNRIHSSCNQLGTATGGFSFSTPPIHKIYKDNELRSCLCADAGDCIIRGSYSQLKYRILAEITGDSNLQQVFNDHHDLPTLTAAQICDKPYNDVTTEERTAAKVVIDGIIQGIGLDGLRTYSYKYYRVELPEDEAGRLYVTFFNEYPDVASWISQQMTSKSNTARTLGGRIRTWPDEHPNKTGLLTYPIQGTSSDIIKKALGDLVTKLETVSADIIFTIDDNILVEYAEDDIESGKQIIHDVMVSAAKHFLRSVPVVVDITVDQILSSNDWNSTPTLPYIDSNGEHPLSC